MGRLVAAALTVALVIAGCGDEGETAADTGAGTTAAAAESTTSDGAGNANDGKRTGPEEDRSPEGAEIVLGDSQFGEMLFAADQQAIYIFERDRNGDSACYGECAAAWPPVYTSGEPVAGKGVNPDLLGTTERRDGRLQVTYDGQPLYFYAHEAPGEVRCHNVDLNGGFWWVVGADGNRLP
jgi:predicted lipoprotein with Yx(FWY)xxD motif